VAEPQPLPGWSVPAAPAPMFPAAPPTGRRRRTGVIVVGAAVAAVVLVAVPAVALGMRKGDDPPKVLAVTSAPVPSPEPSVVPTTSPSLTVPVDLAPKTATPSKTAKKTAKKPKHKANTRVNLIPNGGFENGLAGWTSGNGMPVGDGQHSGKGAAQINAGPNAEARVERVITGLRPKTAYLLTGWVRSGNAYTFLGARDYDATVGIYLPVTVNNYTELGGKFTTGPGVTKVTIFCWRKEAGSGWCDDIALRLFK
jgi:hypothetical protein